MKKLKLIFGCDCDPDRLSFNKFATSQPWLGIEEGIERFNEIRFQIEKNFGIWIKCVWFVRSDFKIKYDYGQYEYSFNIHNKIWKKLLTYGDEIAWHPHLWNIDKNNNWYQEIKDEKFKYNCISNGYNNIPSFYKKIIKTTHAGWCYQDNFTLKTLYELGITIDCSSLPGVSTLYRGSVDRSDWENSPHNPFFVKKDNYKLPSTVKNKSILEIPASTTLSYLSILKALIDFRKEFKISSKIFFLGHHPIYLTFNNYMMKSLISNFLSKNNLKESYLFSYTHADEFLPESLRSNIISKNYNLKFFEKNIKFISDYCYKNNIELSSVTISKFSEKYI